MSDIIYTGSIPLNALTGLLHDYPSDKNEGPFVLMEQLPEHVITHSSTRQDLIIFQSLDTFKQSSQRFPLESYTSGRIFQEKNENNTHNEGELRWERQGAQVQLVYLGDEDANIVPVLQQYLLTSHTLAEMTRNKQEPEPVSADYYLFGERLSDEDIGKIGSMAQQGDFAEVRVPRILRYPTPKAGHGQRMRLKVVEYHDKQTGEVEFFRFKTLISGE
jgi:hypothetical protein